MRQRRPDDLLERAAVELEIERVGVGFPGTRRVTRNEVWTLRTEVNPRRVDRQRCALDSLPAVEVVDVALSRMNRQLGSDHGRNRRSPRPGGVHHPVAGQGATVRESNAGHKPIAAIDLGHLTRHVLDTQRSGLGPEGLQERVRVKPSLVGQAERPAGEVTGLHPPESRAQLVGRKESNRHAVGPLDGVVVLEDLPTRSAGEEQVAALHEIDAERHSPGDTEPFVEVLDEPDAEAADLDVQLCAELQPNRGGGEGR